MSDSNNGPSRTKINKENAIYNLGGMTWLYEKHLSKFKRVYWNSPHTIHALLLSGNFDEARILIHSIKGLSGTLGLGDLYNAASQLEISIIKSAPAMTDRLAFYEYQMLQFLNNQSKE